MKQVSKVLIRTLVKEFYKENAGFLLVVLGLGFGFLKTPQHIDIASALAFQPIYYLVPLVLWILYTLKTLSFCKTAKRLPSNWFLTELNTLKSTQRKPLIIYLQILLLAPTLGYSAFLTYMALELGQWESALAVIIGNGMILLVSAHFLHQTLTKPIDVSVSARLSNWANWLPRGYSMLFIHHLFQRQGLSLIFTKLFSIGVIIGATLIFQVESTDLRYLALGVLLSSGINASFTFKHTIFERQYLKIFKNLPISRTTTFFKDTITYLVLALPEALVLFGNNLNDVSILTLFKLILLLPVLLILHRNIAMTKFEDIEQFSKYIFFSTAFLFFVILGYVDLFIIESIAIIVAAMTYIKLSIYLD